ncbi:hypothetical protein [Streptomyces brasiliensis]|uniref:Secreted protein n=1 Tax=Streptomyces brasiliensis TaxID=1954 RepID=A0A917NS21_9ACTN|nr:hypothetical protein [Streptomyces brasiliensis]GGJ23217.1 hypothetical protein GCM10010121_037710 [Streptomyces brasiliensis]
MRIRRILAAVFATAALAGLGLTEATTATAAALTPGECKDGGGVVVANPNNPHLGLCRGGTGDGQPVD